MLAISLCSLMLALRLISVMGAYPHIGERLYGIFAILLPCRPLYVIHNEIAGTHFFLGSILFLTRKAVWQQLGRRSK
jgi:hypothetical protein